MIHFTMYTLEGVSFNNDVYEVTIPTQNGTIGVLPNHMSLISVAAPGTVLVRHSADQRDDQRDTFEISGGSIFVENNELRILVDEADYTPATNDLQVQEAYMRAEKLKDEAVEHISLQHAQSMVDRQTSRLHVSSIKRRRHHS